jgi:hypothetical protein
MFYTVATREAGAMKNKRQFAQSVAVGRMVLRSGLGKRQFAQWLSVRWGFIFLVLRLYFNWYTLDYFTRAWLRCRAAGLDNQDTAQVLDVLQDRAP